MSTPHPVFLDADWPMPESVGCVVSTRKGGQSTGSYDSLNLADHVGDQGDAVLANRKLVAAQYADIAQWQWLEQTHSADVHAVETARLPITGDGLVTKTRGLACCILTADCLPILLCNEEGSEVAAVHGGWRGLAGGIIGNTLDKMRSSPGSLMAWLGPAIASCHFEVGAEVREQFLAGNPSAAIDAQFGPADQGKYMVDLYGIARTQLQQLGVDRIHGGGLCTYCDSEHFYSYRRDGQCGRMLSAIFLR